MAFYFMVPKYGSIIFVGIWNNGAFLIHNFSIYKEDDLNKTGIFIKGSKYVNVQPRRTLALFSPK